MLVPLVMRASLGSDIDTANPAYAVSSLADTSRAPPSGEALLETEGTGWGWPSMHTHYEDYEESVESRYYPLHFSEEASQILNMAAV